MTRTALPSLRAMVLGATSVLRGGISYGFPLVNNFDFPGSQSVFLYLSILPYVHTHVLAKMDSTAETYG